MTQQKWLFNLERYSTINPNSKLNKPIISTEPGFDTKNDASLELAILGSSNNHASKHAPQTYCSIQNQNMADSHLNLRKLISYGSKIKSSKLLFSRIQISLKFHIKKSHTDSNHQSHYRFQTQLTYNSNPNVSTFK